MKQAIKEILAADPTRVLLSSRKAGPWRRATYSRRNDGSWQAEKLTETQAFHEAVEAAALAAELCTLMQSGLTQLTAFAKNTEFTLRLTAKGKVLTNRKRLAAKESAAGNTAKADDTAKQSAATKPAAGSNGHDRPKRRLLPEGVAVPPLVDIGVMTPNGMVVAAMRDKYRQINRFVELVADALPDDPAGLPNPMRVVDFGCGKSYLSFILYYYFKIIRNVNIELIGLDLKAEVVASCNSAAKKYGYEGLRFEVGDIADYDGGAPPHMVVSLHACDTATDLALAKAVGWGARLIFSVPCCQHELNGQMESDALALLTRYGLVKERTAALMTDAIRANLLAACGYKTQLVEFVGFEHTPKNIMIRAVKRNLPKAARLRYLSEVERLTRAFSLEPTLQRLLNDLKALPSLQ